MNDAKRAQWPWLALVALYLALRLPALLSYAPTRDEPVCVGAGKQFAQTGDGAAAAMRRHPPLAHHISSAPLWFVDTPQRARDPKGFDTQVGVAVLYESKTEAGEPLAPQTVLLLARLPILAFGLLGLTFSVLLGRRLAGDRAGWLAAAAWAAYPEAAAQSVQATTDLVAAVAALGLAYAAVRHVDAIAVRPRFAPRTHAALGAAAGLAAMSGHALLVPTAVVVAATVWLRSARSRSGVEQPPGAAGRFVVAAAVAFGVLWAGYFFEHGPVEGFDGTTSVPMPTYWRSVTAHFETTSARAYLDGEWSDAGFFWYFPVALAVKTPTALLVVIAAGLLGWRAVRRDAGYAADLVLALFAAPLAAAVASRSNDDAGRLLPAATFAMVLGAAAIGRWWDRSPRAAGTTVAVLAAALAVEWTANRFDPLPFANLPSGGPDRLHERLADSNLEAGQDLWALERWCEEHRVESIHVVLNDAPGLYEREVRTSPYLRQRLGINPARLCDSIVAGGVPQTGDVPARGLIALGESAILRPLGFSRVVDVEPLARVGRTRIYRTTP